MANQYDEETEEGQWQEDATLAKPKLGNTLPIWGNPRTMNLNHLVLTNIQNSSYFKVRLFELKTYHEVVDEIYYKVEHLEPWERGTRKTAGQTGMCGGVRGVGAGGVVSTSFCCLFKLFTLKLTRKQVNSLLVHPDSPYIRGLGIMYVRYTQPPKDLWDWFEYLLDDEEEVDVKSGGGFIMTIGMMVRTVLTKLEWFSTLFPRIPVPIEKQIHENLKQRGLTGARAGEEEDHSRNNRQDDRGSRAQQSVDVERESRASLDRNKSRERSHHRSSQQRTPDRKHRSRSRDKNRSRRSRSRDKSQRSRDRRSRSRERKRSRDREDRSRDRRRDRRSRSRDRKRRSRSRSPGRRRGHRSR